MKRLVIFIILAFLMVSCVSAADNSTASVDASKGNVYVDCVYGDDLNTGTSSDLAFKTLEKAISVADNDSTIYVSDGVYSGANNTRVTINKSVNIVGSQNTTFDGLNKDYIFVIEDNAHVTLRNINLINAYKSPSSFGVNYQGSVWGGALEIKNSTVLVENCVFESNVVDYQNNYVYGGAISNMGHLTIKDTSFISNIVRSTSGLLAFGGSIYNKGIMDIDSSSFSNSTNGGFVYGGVIANDGDLTINNTSIDGAVCGSESRGSAIYNTGNLTIINSCISNSIISKSNFQYVYGAVYNSGHLNAYGNIFTNNSAVYSIPSKGSPTIYNVGDIDLKYNMFLNNHGFSGVYKDLYLATSEVISVNYNWWGGDPQMLNSVNTGSISSWLVLNITPDYSMLDLNGHVDIVVLWGLNNGDLAKSVRLPFVNITINGQNYQLKDSIIYTFVDTQTKGLKHVNVSLGNHVRVVEVDVGKEPVELTVGLKNNLSYLEALDIDVDVKGGSGVVEGIVTIEIGENLYSLNLTDGHANTSINGLNPGSYNVHVSYGGSENHFKSFESVDVDVSRRDINMSVEISDVFVEDSATATVNIGSKSSQGQAAVYINGQKTKIVYLYEGITKIPLNNFREGTYNITISYFGNTYYNPFNITRELRVKKYASAFNITAPDIHYGKTQQIQITVEPSDLRGEAILKINDFNSTVFINSQTTNVTLSNLEVGEYNLELVYAGDAKYAPANSSASFKVYKTASSLDVKVNYDENTLKGSILVKANALNCTGSVNVYINYKIYQMDLKNGMATFDVFYDNGTNYILVVYEGDDYWADSSWDATIGKAGPFILTAQDQTSWQFNDFNYTVRLIEENGMPLISRNVTIEFNDQYYNITTDNNGYAHFNLNLDVGTYSIKATYNDQTITNTLTVNRIQFNLTAQDVSFTQEEVFIAEFDKSISGRFNFTVDGVLSVSTNIINGTAIYAVKNLKVGQYTLKGHYFNDYFTSNDLTTDFNVIKADSVLNWYVGNVISGEDANITVVLLDNATGEVTFVLDNKKYVKSVENSKAILFVKNIAGGNHTLTIDYAGDGNFNGNTLKTSFYIKNLRSNFILNVSDITYGDKLTVKAYLNNDTTGTVKFNIGEIEKTAYLFNGVASFDFDYLDAGNYTLNAIYSGDEYYISSANSTQFAVYKAISSINITCDAYLEENIMIYAYLSPRASGYVSFSMIDYYSSRNKPISDDVSLWYISPLNPGAYQVKAQYSGDNNYYPSNVTYLLNVLRYKPKLTVSIADVVLDENVVVNVKLFNASGTGITGTVKLTIGLKDYDVEVIDGEGTLILGRMPLGNHSYRAIYTSPDLLEDEVITGSFSVLDEIPVVIESKNVTKYYKGSEKLEIYLKDSSGNLLKSKDVVVNINSKKQVLKTDFNGKAILDLDLKSGEYIASITFNAQDRYKSASLKVSVIVKETVTGVDSSVYAGSPVSYFAMFLDSSGNPLSNANVKFTIAGKTVSVKTFANGVSRLNIYLNPGNYSIKATNPLTGEVATNYLFVWAKIMNNKDATYSYGGNNYYKVRIYGNDGEPVGAGVGVGFKINGHTYKVKTNKNGYASLRINLKPSKYTISISYGGYAVKNKVTIKSVIKAKNLNVKKSSKQVKVKVSLKKVNGRYLAGKKVTLKINGKKIAAKTNKKGVVTFTIRKNILNALKVGKSYRYQVIYLKDSVKKTIKVK